MCSILTLSGIQGVTNSAWRSRLREASLALGVKGTGRDDFASKVVLQDTILQSITEKRLLRVNGCAILCSLAPEHTCNELETFDIFYFELMLSKWLLYAEIYFWWLSVWLNFICFLSVYLPHVYLTIYTFCVYIYTSMAFMVLLEIIKTVKQIKEWNKH